ncbi:NADH:flavin oxidoreductase [Chloroflexota bacterium]
MDMKDKAVSLFSTGSIGRVELRNRMLMPPVNTNYGDEQGFVTDKAIGFYRKRAAGGVGGLILEAMQVDPLSKIVVREMGVYDDLFVEGLHKLAEVIHSEGAKAFVQLNHGGPKAAYELNGVQCTSASSIPVKKDNIPRPLEVPEIQRIVALHADAAQRVQQAGFDGVELQACHFYLLSAFLSGYLNRRIDDYGGTTANRCRFVVEIIEAVKARCGRDFPVIVRINAFEDIDRGISAEEGQQISRILESAGADAIHASAAAHPVNPDIEHLFELKVGGAPPREAPPGCFSPLAEGIKRCVRIPVITVGKILEPATASEIINQGQADFVALGRALIADPELPNKAARGADDAIVSCCECRVCHTSMQQKGDLVCAVNPNLY